jgi:chromosome segregation ATPase
MFGKIMSFGKKVVKKVEAVIEGKEEEPEEEYKPLVKSEIGACKDMRLEMWPTFLEKYIEGVRDAKDIFPAVVKRIEFLIEKIKDMKEDRAKLMELMSAMTGMEKAKTAAILAGDIVQF